MNQAIYFFRAQMKNFKLPNLKPGRARYKLCYLVVLISAHLFMNIAASGVPQSIEGFRMADNRPEVR